MSDSVKTFSCRPDWASDPDPGAIHRAIEKGLERLGSSHKILPPGPLADAQRARERKDAWQRKLRAAHRELAEWLHGSGTPVPHLTWEDKVKRPATPWKGNDQCNPPAEASAAVRQIEACLRPQLAPPARALTLSKAIEPPTGCPFVPETPTDHGSLKRATHWIKRRLRPVSRWRVRGCGWAVLPLEREVTVVVGPSGVARYSGLLTCGSVWECPTCATRIRAARATELERALDGHDAGVVVEHGRRKCRRAAMLTLTISHGLGDDLRGMRKALGDAYRGLTRGKQWAAWKRRAGVAGVIRCLEVTHGENGWHPHLHVLLLLDEPVRKAELGRGGEWSPAWRSWLVERWTTMVRRYVGNDHAPAEPHGVSLKPLNRDTYLAKLGLEMADPFAKGAKNGNRSPWQIAGDYARSRVAREGELWRAYCDGMRGAQQLCWSAGLKRRFGIANLSDEALLEEEGVTKVVMRIPRDAWVVIRSVGVVVAGERRCATEWLLALVATVGERVATMGMLEILDQAPASTRLAAAVHDAERSDVARATSLHHELVGGWYTAAERARCAELVALERVCRQV